MSEDYAQQLIDILLLSDNFRMPLKDLINKVAEFDIDSNDDKSCLAEAFDMLLREKLIWTEQDPVYEKRHGHIHFNDMQIGLTETGANASIN